MAKVQLQDVRKSFGAIDIIRSINLTIDHGEFCVLVGPSGCGKSTLLRMIAGLETISDGAIAIDEDVVNDVDPSARGIAMVFQSYALYPHMTVEQNMGFGLKMTKHKKEEIDRRVHEAAKILQLGKMLDRKPSQLSGGQRQRVAIGRAIVRNPKVFLFDEPLSNLDAELRVSMRVEIAKLHQELGNTMIYVTHDQTEAMTLADKIVVMRSGRIEQFGAPLDLYNDPDNLFVAGFIGSPKMNFIPAEAVGARELRFVDGSSIALPNLSTSLTIGQKISLGIRPEHLDKGDDSSASVGVIVDVVERLGATTFAYGRTISGEPITAELRSDRPIASGDKLALSFALNNARLFDTDGNRIR